MQISACVYPGCLRAPPARGSSGPVASLFFHVLTSCSVGLWRVRIVGSGHMDGSWACCTRNSVLYAGLGLTRLLCRVCARVVGSSYCYKIRLIYCSFGNTQCFRSMQTAVSMALAFFWWVALY
ncbi:hypothetical protein SETIT_7G089800v2 [Setaria italica]|uniref:Uncharacterized protein n=2 Tax=Setaria TaxID=4554 RepID=A0A368RTN8_SETIT|nr:hypothetical protein SETIT_7G089800v2 [Setaria italica]TKW04267.1 hypothetical protein SEVIR_7G097600v2 [Setaria viridis]